MYKVLILTWQYYMYEYNIICIESTVQTLSIFYICTLRMFDQRLAPHIKWYRNRY